MKYFALPKDGITPTSPSSAFLTFSQQLYHEQACSAVSDAGQRARQEERRGEERRGEGESVLDRVSGRRQASNLTCARATSVEDANAF